MIRIGNIYSSAVKIQEQGAIFPGEVSAGVTLLCVLAGPVHCVIQGRHLLLERGTMVLCGPGQWYMQYADPNVESRLLIFAFETEGELPDSLYGVAFSAGCREQEAVDRIRQELEHPDKYSGDMIPALLTQLILQLLRRGAENPEPSGEAAIILKAQRYIADHSREQLSVPIVAWRADVSASYLTALFRKNLGISPGEYIRRVKLEESRQMIREGELNFTQIAAALEYSTVHHFSRQFKENFGITPTEYARSIR